MTTTKKHRKNISNSTNKQKTKKKIRQQEGEQKRDRQYQNCKHRSKHQVDCLMEFSLATKQQQSGKKCRRTVIVLLKSKDLLN